MAGTTRKRDRFSTAYAALTNFALTCGVLLAAVVPGVSQGDATVPQITPETVVRYLQQDIFISPGIGFDKVKIGQPFAEVAAAWGVPDEASGHDPAQKNAEATGTDGGIEWVYLAGRDSRITLTGGSNVNTITVEGSLSSPFASAEGANFGMTPQQVISIYGPPTTSGSLTQIDYSSQGVAFGFEHGSLKTIRVFNPKPASTSASEPRSVK